MTAVARPLDEASWPSQLTARVVSPGPRARIHGYDVEGDLAQHHSFAETVLLALTGELPTAEQARAFEVALVFASPAPVNEAPTHAAVLARICAGSTSSILGTAAIGLAEQARALIDTHRTWVDSGEGPTPEVPTALLASSEEERSSVNRLRDALRGTIDLPVLARDLGRSAAVVATLHACGLRRGDQIEFALVLGRLPVAVAEALATPPGSYRDYPVLLPTVAYEAPLP